MSDDRMRIDEGIAWTTADGRSYMPLGVFERVRDERDKALRASEEWRASSRLWVERAYKARDALRRVANGCPEPARVANRALGTDDP